MSATLDPLAVTPLPALTRDEITHRVLALCVETAAIARRPLAYLDPATGVDWRIYLRGKYTSAPVRLNLSIALTSLEAAGLITWYDDRNATGTQYAEETPAGKAMLLHWDAELFGGAQ